MNIRYLIFLCMLFACKSKKTNLVYEPIANGITYQNNAIKQPLETIKTDTSFEIIHQLKIERKTIKKYKKQFIEKDSLTNKKFDGLIPLGTGILLSTATGTLLASASLPLLALGMGFIGGIAAIYFLIKGIRKIRKNPENYKFKFWSYLLFIGTALLPFILLGLILLMQYAYK